MLRHDLWAKGERNLQFAIASRVRERGGQRGGHREMLISWQLLLPADQSEANNIKLIKDAKDN